jgi:hypothetical protein
VWQAVAALAYYTPENNPILYREAKQWLELVLSEDEAVHGRRGRGLRDRPRG